MITTPAITPAFDPLLYHAPLPYRRTFYPLGFAAAIATNYEPILHAAAELWGRFEQRHPHPALELRFLVSDTPATGQPPPSSPRGQGNLITTVMDASNFLVCDLQSGFAFGWFTPAVACDIPFFRYHFLEAYVYILQARYLTKIHAACIALDGRGVLVCGDSAAGKSTLSYACARRGWTYIADDGLGLIRNTGASVVAGNPYLVRFRPESKSLFPELAPFSPVERPNGKPGLEVDTALLHIPIGYQTSADFIVFLDRASGGPQSLAQYDKQEAFAQLSGMICYGDDLLQNEQRHSLERLLSAPVYQMRYHSLDWAEERLRCLVQATNP